MDQLLPAVVDSAVDVNRSLGDTFDLSGARTAPMRLSLLRELRRAVEGDEFLLYFQPIVSLRSDRLVAAEALVRWQHPTRGVLAPAKFLRAVEQSPLMPHLTRIVLRQALTQYRAWYEGGWTLPVVVNLSSRDLLDSKLVDDVAALEREFRLSDQWLRLEITESMLIREPERAIATTARLRKMGIEVALDDFGTGYSSLSYLQRLPIDVVKIDRSFVRDLARRDREVVIVKASIQLAHSLGFGVAAEGVEDEVALKMLRALGCDMAQGYFLSRPRPAASLDGWIRSGGWTPRDAGAERKLIRRGA